jgi:hypothetical protein
MPYPFEPSLEAMNPENLRKHLARIGESNWDDWDNRETDLNVVIEEETNCEEN